MKKCIQFRLVSIFAITSILSACSSPIGDFGRIDAAKATHLTKIQPIFGHSTETPIYFNPINYSKSETKFRQTAHLLLEYDFGNDKKKPIENDTAVKYFNATGLNAIFKRHQTIALHIAKLHNNLHSFQKLTNQVLQQDSARLNVRTNNNKYMQGVNLRHQENIGLIRRVALHLGKLNNAYIHVLDHGKIVEPNLADGPIRYKLERFSLHVEQLKSSIY